MNNSTEDDSDIVFLILFLIFLFLLLCGFIHKSCLNVLYGKPFNSIDDIPIYNIKMITYFLKLFDITHDIISIYEILHY